ncbi:hypothetical protein KUTeg_003770 [Tegillarca granosa]|uniref:Uncharacterized protein n=1 Tax=Tegillarca granosa TaxID=220873 RepID=A0ABQ9FMZ5_TEGGR|nr:hypothetical protein KUTeg_003770 [Tegillarca granosa]
MQDCKIEHVTSATVHNLSYNSLKTLIFQNCQIYNIDQDTFLDIKNQLYHLEINANHVSASNVSKSLTSLNKSVIRTIALRYNFWDSIPKTMFNHLSKSQLDTLTLCLFKMKHFNGFLLSGLYKLKKLTICTEKSLESVSIRGMPSSIEQLTLSGNNLRHVPNFCTHNSALLPNLKILNVNRNSIKKIKSWSLHCLHTLKRLLMVSNYLVIIKDNTFSQLMSLEYLVISSQMTFIKKIEPFAFNSSTLLHLNLFNNNFDFKRTNVELIFKLCPRLKFLDLSNTVLRLGYIQLRRMFISLTNLEVLLLTSVGIRALPSGLFPHLKSLKRLDLDGNYITGWEDDPGIFMNITWMQQLNLKR